jgi:hypothetical protein
MDLIEIELECVKYVNFDHDRNNYGLFWMWKGTFGFDKILGIS